MLRHVRRLSASAQQAGRLAPPAPLLESQGYLVSKVVANHLRRAAAVPLPREAAAAAADADAAARGAPSATVAALRAERPAKTRLSSTPEARPPTFELDTTRVALGTSQRDSGGGGEGGGGGKAAPPSHWPGDDFKEMLGEMKTTIGRFAGLPAENVRFRISLVPLSLDTKDCITSVARPNTPPASLIANYVSEQIEGGKLRELGSARGVSSLVKEIYAAYGPHTGRRRYLKGLRILVSGRLGQERASTASAIEGTLPLSTLDADVDYAMRRATTRSGIVGIKIWCVNDGVPLATGEGA